MKTKRIIFPVLAAMAAVGAAFATGEKKEEKRTALATYYVLSQDATSYEVTTTVDPNCRQTGTQLCAISSSEMPDGNNRIPKDKAMESGWKN